jgi:hypothetical protein
MSKGTRQQIEDLAELWDMTLAGVVARAIDRLHTSVLHERRKRAGRLVDTREPYRTEAE